VRAIYIAVIVICYSGACSALRELYINNNAKFAMLPGTAGHLRKLQELSMRKCPALKQLPVTGICLASPPSYILSPQLKI